MVDTSTVPSAKSDTAKACQCRTGVFVYDLLVVFALLAAAITYVKHLSYFSLGSANVDIALRAM